MLADMKIAMWSANLTIPRKRIAESRGPEMNLKAKSRRPE
jgi:hypothetical protein